MKEYEQYHKKGGFYEIPVEIFNELLADIEDSNDSIIWWQNRFNALNRDNEKLQQRIDKAIEYLYKHSQYNDADGIHYIDEDEYCVDYLLDILKGE